MTQRTPREQLVVALDGSSLTQAMDLVDLLRPEVDCFEVGVELYTACGPAIVEEIRKAGGQVFLDLKFHDIPSTVAKAVAVATRLGCSTINVHISGGEQMLREACKALQRTTGPVPTKLIGVTVLTSMETLGDVGVQFEVREQVMRLAKLAQQVGLHGVNTSPLEIALIRQQCRPEFLIISPGIRSVGEQSNDQRRVGGPRQAIGAGADYIVVGRPITEARDPVAAVKKILHEMV